MADIVAAAAMADEPAALASLPGVLRVHAPLGELTLEIDRLSLRAVMTALVERFGYQQCMDICGVDWPERTPRFEVVYNLLSVTRNTRVRVVTTTDGADPVPSVCMIWPCATWWEREAWDLFGIVFEGQPDLRRILTDYGFEGHPLRKDFPLTGYVQVRYDEDRKAVINEPVQLTQEFRNFDFLSPWEAMTTLPGDEKVPRDRLARADTDEPSGLPPSRTPFVEGPKDAR